MKKMFLQLPKKAMFVFTCLKYILLIIAGKSQSTSFRCVINMALLFLCQQNLTVFNKLIRVLTKKICQSLFVKRFYFTMFYNIFFQTQLVFVFILSEIFILLVTILLFFYFFLLQKGLDSFHKLFLETFLCFFCYIQLTSLQTFLHLKKKKNYTKK